MHRLLRLAAMLVLLCCFLFLAVAAHAQQQPHHLAASDNPASPPSCIPHERDALLEFKHGVTSDPAGVLNSWRRDGGHGEQDCCRWRGVRCSNRTGHVHKLQLGGAEGVITGQISPALLALDHLEHLDLSWNYLDGPSGRFPEFLGSLKSLRYLNLSGIPFYGSVPAQLGNLSKLQYLDLSDMGGMNSTDLSFLTRLPSIEYLNLNGVNLSAVVDWPHVMNMLPCLRVLRLSHCSLASAIHSLPHLNLTNLEELDASWNYFNHPMVPSWFWNITSLKYLYLDATGMFGQFPDALGNMTYLQVLDLSCNNCYNDDDDDDDDEKSMRVMTADLKNLCNLEVLNLFSSLLHGDVTDLFSNLPHCSPNKLQELDLCGNQLSGMLPRWIGQLTGLVVLNLCWNNITGSLPTSVGQLASLQILDLSYNNLTGSLPTSVGQLASLQRLDLSCNNLTGSLPTSVGQLASLQRLDLSYNNLNRNVPSEIGMLSNLVFLYLDSNKLDGVITEEHFASARSLQNIDLSYNTVKIEISPDWQPPFRLDTANFASCQMGPLFPGWLQWQVTITQLDMSSAGIADRLPQWFSDAFSNVQHLDISNNRLNGSLPTNMSFMSLELLLLSSNELTGQIPTLLPPNITILDLSNNSLSGLQFSSNGSSNLMALSLFSNQITGRIPESVCKHSGLVVLDLSNNFLEVELPSCLGQMELMQYMSLSNNSLSGEFPSFVQNLTSAVFLDLSRNKFFGRLPMWIGNLMQLRVLRLSHNKFFGNIPVNLTNLDCLQYMDLSNNEISGSLPSYLLNLKAMRKDGCLNVAYYYRYGYFFLSSLSAVLKGEEMNYGSVDRVFDTNMTSIDLSSNNLTGKIPEEIVALDALVNLNLSRNHLSGVVPNKIGGMQSLESLDLSRNKLSGEIPTTLSNLTFLGYLDLSYNNFTGRIPSGRQLDTLYADYPSMYNGNIGLCGRPLQNSCSSEGDAPKQGGQGIIEEDHGIQFFYLGLGCGFVVGTWMAFGVLLFERSWRIAFFQFPDKLYDKIYALIAIWARQTRADHDA